MKKTSAMIYRFIFILFCVWGICRKVGFNILWLTPKILDFTLFINILSFACILTVFVLSITRYPGRLLMGFKSVLTVCSIFVFADNFYLISSGLTYNWILGILLPIMMIVDWIIFDKKGDFNFYDPLIWSFASLLAIFLLGGLLKLLFGVDEIFSVIGLFGNINDFLRLAGLSLVAGIVMYMLDCLVSAFSKKNAKNAFSIVFRVVLILLEIYAFKVLVGSELTGLIYSLQYYHYLSNFLAVIAIGVILVYNLIKFKTIKRTSTPIPRIKGAFTLCMIVTLISQIFYGENILSLSFSEIIIYYIAPVMMILDWILFDNKGYFKIYDPLLWSVIPLVYFFVLPLFLDLELLGYMQAFVIRYGIIIIVGYIYYIADKILSHRN